VEFNHEKEFCSLISSFSNCNFDLSDSDDEDHQKVKRRGRPNSTNTTSQKWSIQSKHFHSFFPSGNRTKVVEVE
jgi:hypothetical protein